MDTTRQYGPRADRALTMWVKLARASAVFGHRTHEQIRSFGLTPAQFGVLEIIGHRGPMTLGELCRRSLVTGGNITVVIRNLEKAGLVARERKKEDQRATVARLTRRGELLFQRIFPPHAAYVADLASVLAPGEQDELGRLLKKLGTRLARAGESGSAAPVRREQKSVHSHPHTSRTTFR